MKRIACSRLICLISLGLVLFAGCYYGFTSIDQPDVADPNSAFDVPITAQITAFEVEPPETVIPLFGILLPEGWSVMDSIPYRGVLSGTFLYSRAYSDSMEKTENAPDGYYWWVSVGTSAKPGRGMCSFTPRIQINDQRGTFLIDYMVGCDYDGEISDRRRSGHPISIGMPTRVTVTNTNDSGEGSLRQAIADVSSSGEIVFDLTYPATIVLDRELVVDRNVAITGPTSGSLTISGNNAVRVFRINDNLRVHMSNLTISDGNAGEEKGGGILVEGQLADLGSGTLTLSNCVVRGNQAESGGGIHFKWSSSRMVGGLITGNTASSTGGGISCFECSPSFENVIVSHNTAGANGGGISCFGGPSFENVIVSHNTAGADGGGIWGSESSMNLGNVTVHGNTAERGGGIYCMNWSSPSLANTILWSNAPEEIHFGNAYGVHNSITIAYSDIQGGEAGIVTHNNVVYWLEGNIDADPLFVDASGEDFRLQEGSPCIDAGTPLPGRAYEGLAPDMGADLYVIDVPAISISDDTLYCRGVSIGDTATIALSLSNIGNELLIVRDISSDNMDYALNIADVSIDPGERAEVLVTFIPTAAVPRTGTLTIRSNDPDDPSVEVVLLGEGLIPPAISVSPDALSEILSAGQIATQRLTLENTGSSDLHFDVLPGESGQNYALQFDGVDGYVAVDDYYHTAGEISELTVCVWVKSSSSSRQIIVSWDRFHYWELLLTGATDTGNIQWATSATHSTIGANAWHELNTRINYADGQWHFVCGWFKAGASPDKRIFVDGQLVASEAAHDGYNLGSGVTRYGFIGVGSEASSFNGGKYRQCRFNGQMDEIRIWNVARTQTEIQADMHRELTGKEPGLVGYWSFNEGAGKTVLDRTSKNSDGILYGGVTWVPSSAPVMRRLSCTPDSGVCSPGSSIDLQITFDATGLDAGEYDATIHIVSNDPKLPERTIPVHFQVSTAVGVDGQHAGHIPQSYALHQNHPNPFNPITTIAYDLPKAGDVKLTIYTITGQQVGDLVDAHLQAGHHTVRFDGSGLANGVYLYRLEAGSFVETRRMLLLK